MTHSLINIPAPLHVLPILQTAMTHLLTNCSALILDVEAAARALDASVAGTADDALGQGAPRRHNI